MALGRNFTMAITLYLTLVGGTRLWKMDKMLTYNRVEESKIFNYTNDMD